MTPTRTSSGSSSLFSGWTMCSGRSVALSTSPTTQLGPSKRSPMSDGCTVLKMALASLPAFEVMMIELPGWDGAKAVKS